MHLRQHTAIPHGPDTTARSVLEFHSLNPVLTALRPVGHRDFVRRTSDRKNQRIVVPRQRDLSRRHTRLQPNGVDVPRCYIAFVDRVLTRSNSKQIHVIPGSTVQRVVTSQTINDVRVHCPRQCFRCRRTDQLHLRQHTAIPHGPDTTARSVLEFHSLNPVLTALRPVGHRDFVRRSSDRKNQRIVVPRQRDLCRRHTRLQPNGVDVPRRRIVFVDRVLPRSNSKKIHVIPGSTVQRVVSTKAINDVGFICDSKKVVAANCAFQEKTKTSQHSTIPIAAIGKHYLLDTRGDVTVPTLDRNLVTRIGKAQHQVRAGARYRHVRRDYPGA